MPQFDRPQSTRDFLPAETATRSYVQSKFAEVTESYGFQAVQTPMFEKVELFLAQSGKEIKDALLSFRCDQEEYALRPEMTAPVCRLASSGVFSGLEGAQKLYYIAPCFRYCRPQSDRYREFVQAGLEVIGAVGSSFDAEIIAVSCQILRRLGISNRALKIGNIGVFRDLLPPELNSTERAVVIGHLDRFVGIEEKCQSLLKNASTSPLENLNRDRMELLKLQQKYAYSGPLAIETRPVLELEEYPKIFPEEAAATFRKIWDRENLVPTDTADLLLRVSRLRGSLSEVHQEAEAILKDTSAITALEELVSVCRNFEMYKLGDFEVALGIARGFTFYTSTVFDISSSEVDDQRFCGGGRYDGLVEEFGGPQLPATGCAFWFDSLVDAFISETKWSAPRPYELCLLVESQALVPRVITKAELLRSRGLRVGVELGPQTPPTAKDCSSRRADLVALVGIDELNRKILHVSDGSTVTEIPDDPESVFMWVKKSLNGKNQKT